MSTTELSLDISNLVARSLAGEAIDIAKAGEDLAARYPDLGLPGGLIAKAIARAAAMMGVVLEGWEEATLPPPLPAARYNPAGPAERVALDIDEPSRPPGRTAKGAGRSAMATFRSVLFGR